MSDEQFLAASKLLAKMIFKLCALILFFASFYFAIIKNVSYLS